jgi:hypothetical protein
MKINYKKVLKLATLLISSLLIATVSADVFKSMFMEATPIGVAGANKVEFWVGTDFPTNGTDIEITDARQKVKFTGMEGSPGSATNYSDPVKINNTDTVASHQIELKLNSWDAGATLPLYYINITLFDDTNAKNGTTIHLVPGGSGQVESTGDVTMDASDVWRTEWIIYWKGTAASETVNVYLELIVKT